MAKKLTAINDSEIDKLIRNIDDYNIKIKKILNEVSTIISDTSSYYDCNYAKTYRNRFNAYKSNFSVVSSNILTYKSDMQKLKNAFSKKHVALSDLVNEKTRQVNSKK